MEVAIQIIIGIVVGVLSAIVIDFRNEWRTDKKEQLLKDSARDDVARKVLGYLLRQMYITYTKQGSIPLDRLHEAREIYDLYHFFGGNGTGTMQIQKLEQLPNSDIEK